MQEEIIQSALDGKDTLALLPTGGGKSICFQVPALVQEGICIVISPLIALMQDQVENLKKRGIEAEAIYSGMHYRQIDRILDNCIYGKTKFLYLSPERLKTDIARERIKKMNVNLLAIDEAHCISQWGYDFRPPYLEIADFREFLPKVPVLALTATATAEVVEDIQERLAFRAKNVFQKSFSRSNLAYVVLEEEDKMGKMLDILRKVQGSGIVYVRNRRKTKEIAQFLLRNRISADFYHGGLKNDERSEKQQNWIQNRTRIVVATNAFGMGIDKPDVRAVIHLDLPDSLEAYFQEAGRAGRDGKKAYATLLYNDNNRLELEKQFEKAYPDFEFIKQVYQALGSYLQLATGGGLGESYDFNIVEFSKTFRLDLVKSFSALKILEKAGWVMLTEAVYIPSTIKILVNNEQLYGYQILNRKQNVLIKAILRSSQGAFNNHTKINERQLAYLLKTQPSQIISTLKLMQKDEIIDYKEQKENPQLLFLKERVATDNLLIDQEQYAFLKNRQKIRIGKAVQYAISERCRSQMLLEYFGEKDAPECGQCDIDLGRNQVELTQEELKEVGNFIYKILKNQPHSIQEIVRRFPSNRQKRVLKTIDYLQDNMMIERKDNKLIWKGR
jgi:ATP-dependent DNA helicase RecQ